MIIERAFRPGPLSARVLTIVLVLAPGLSVFSPIGLTPLFIVAALAALGLPARPGPHPWPARPLLIGLALFHLWQILSLIWCLDPAQALRSTLGTIALTLGGLVLVRAIAAAPAPLARRLVDAAALGLLIGAPLFLIEFHGALPVRQLILPPLTGHPYPTLDVLPQRLNRAAVLFALFALPVGLALARQRAWRRLGACIALALVVVLTSLSATAKIALLLGPLLALAAWGASRVTLAGLRVVLVGLLLLPLFFASLPDTQQVRYDYPHIPTSLHHRLTIWRFTAQHVLEKPLAGWGMDASRSIPGAEEERVILPPPNTNARILYQQMLPLHPHNATLQIWLELGGIGAALALFLVLAVTSVLGKAPPLRRALGLGQMAQVAVIASISFGIWQAWWLALIWLSVGLALAATAPDETAQKPA